MEFAAWLPVRHGHAGEAFELISRGVEDWFLAVALPDVAAAAGPVLAPPRERGGVRQEPSRLRTSKGPTVTGGLLLLKRRPYPDVPFRP